ncbi:MAG: hypothetical protein ABUL62_32420 [Myxococcales bacterium]
MIVRVPVAHDLPTGLCRATVFDIPSGPPPSVRTKEVSGAFARAEVKLLASLDSSADPLSAVERGASFEHENVYAVTFGNSA